MDTSVVSGRIDSDVKTRATRYIRASGLTVGDVIKNVMESIAQTGTVPQPYADSCASQSADDRLHAFMDVRSSLPLVPALIEMSDDQMRNLIASRYEVAGDGASDGN